MCSSAWCEDVSGRLCRHKCALKWLNIACMREMALLRLAASSMELLLLTGQVLSFWPFQIDRQALRVNVCMSVQIHGNERWNLILPGSS